MTTGQTDLRVGAGLAQTVQLVLAALAAVVIAAASGGWLGPQGPCDGDSCAPAVSGGSGEEA